MAEAEPASAPLAAAPAVAQSRPPSYEELHRGAAYSSSGRNYLKAARWPNGLIVTVVRTEVLAGYENKGWDAYWIVTSEDKDPEGKPIEGEALLRETVPIAKKMAELKIESPVGRKFLLTQIEVQGKKTFQIGRVL